MRMRTAALLVLLTAAAGCAQHPRDAVLSLDTDARQYRTRECRESRMAALNYRDNALARAAVGVAGNLVVPLVGSAAALAMSAERERERQRLNARVGETCLPDPWNERPRSRRAPRRPAARR